MTIVIWLKLTLLVALVVIICVWCGMLTDMYSDDDVATKIRKGLNDVAERDMEEGARRLRVVNGEEEPRESDANICPRCLRNIPWTCICDALDKGLPDKRYGRI